jgi:hypothetical protein
LELPDLRCIVVLDAVEVPPALNVDVITYAAVLEPGEFVIESLITPRLEVASLDCIV